MKNERSPNWRCDSRGQTPRRRWRGDRPRRAERRAVRRLFLSESRHTTEAQDFTRLAPEFAKLDAQILAVSRDAPAKLCKFRDKYGLTVRLASDEDGAVCEAFGTWVEKQNYGRTYMGIERSTFLFGADGKLV